MTRLKKSKHRQNPNSTTRTVLQFDAIGTHWCVECEYSDRHTTNTIGGIIQQTIQGAEKIYSRFRKDSLISEIATRKGIYTFPEDAGILISLYHKLYKATEGRFTPLIGSVLHEAGYDDWYSLTPQSTIHTPPLWEEVMKYTYPELVTSRPVLLDFGAGGKGHIVDLVANQLRTFGINNYMINAGGDIAYLNPENKILSIGLEHPDDTSQIIGVYSLKNGSFCGSAGNRRKWDRFHHIIDPVSLSSPNMIAAVWIAAATTLEADALATALFFTSPASLMHICEFEYLILNSDLTATFSNGFRSVLF